MANLSFFQLSLLAPWVASSQYQYSKILIAICGRIFYNLFLHPLRSYPGPKIAAATQLWHTMHSAQGTLTYEITRLHDEYGDVVRIAPNELSYITAQAWTDIYGLRNDPEFLKDPNNYFEGSENAHSLVVLPTKEHRAARKQLAHGFSEKAMREQEPIFMQYLDLFIKRLHEKCNNGAAALDVIAWFNFFSFDIIGELAFGEPFGCLEAADNVKYGAYIKILLFYGLPRSLFAYLAPPSLLQKTADHCALTREKTDRRIESKSERVDFLHNVLKDDFRNSPQDIYALAGSLIVAGSETTATLCSGLTYYLFKNPQAMATLVDEIRSTFSSEEEINMLSTSQLKYLGACLQEGLRIFPPAPEALPRLVPKDGANVNGQFVPGGVSVGVAHYGSYHSSRNWTLPKSFIPERWLGDKRFENDQRGVHQPFSFGPRNCIGKNLAYAEMRLIMARVLWNFDLKLDPRSQGWEDQKTFLLWAKEPLYVYLKPRVHQTAEHQIQTGEKMTVLA